MIALYLENVPQKIWYIEQKLGAAVKSNNMLDSQQIPLRKGIQPTNKALTNHASRVYLAAER